MADEFENTIRNLHPEGIIIGDAPPGGDGEAIMELVRDVAKNRAALLVLRQPGSTASAESTSTAAMRYRDSEKALLKKLNEIIDRLVKEGEE